MYMFAKHSFSNMAKEIKLAIDQQDSNLKHTQILDALAVGLGEKDFQSLSKNALSYEGVKSNKLYVSPDLAEIINLKSITED